MKIRHVRKRDGSLEPFDKAKIASAVARAQAAVGENDPPFAGEVAEIVEMTLVRRAAGERAPGATVGSAGGAGSLPASLSGSPAGIEEIQDLVEQALIEIGHAQVAKAYILYRDRRARIRAATQVRSESQDGATATSARHSSGSSSSGELASRSARGPRVQVSGGLASWKKSRIVAALLDEADLPHKLAEDVATRVEERVFDSGLKRISTALIRELVDNELVDMGLSQALRKQRPVGLPRHDLRRMLAASEPEDRNLAAHGESLEPRGPEARIAGEILRRYALEDVLPESSSELHLAGEISIEDLERPHLPLCAAIPCDLLLHGESDPRRAFEMLDDLAPIVRSTSYGVVLEDCGALIQALARNSRGVQGGSLSSFLLALGALARGLDRRIDLCVTPQAARAETADSANTAPPGWLVRLLEELVEIENERRGGSLPRVFLDAHEIVRFAESSSALAGAAETLLQRGRLVPTYGGASSGSGSSAGGARERHAAGRGERERFAGPGQRRLARERGALWCGGACALNLPRAARRAGPWREDALLENLAQLVESALDALAALREFQRSDRAPVFPGSSGAPRWSVPRGRVSYALVPVGLREALRWLGDGELRPEQGARVLSFLSEAAQRFGPARGLSVVVTPFFGERAAQRFATLDAELFQVEQPLLFETGIDRERRPRDASYSAGYDLAPQSPGLASAGSALPASEAALVSVLVSGALHPPSILRSLSVASSAQPHPWLAALERLDRARSRLRAGAHALYALPPEPSGEFHEVEGEVECPPESHAVRDSRSPAASADLYTPRAPLALSAAGIAPRERRPSASTRTPSVLSTPSDRSALPGEPRALHTDDT